MGFFFSVAVIGIRICSFMVVGFCSLFFIKGLNLLIDSEFWVLMIGLFWVFGDMNWFNLDFFFWIIRKLLIHSGVL